MSCLAVSNPKIPRKMSDKVDRKELPMCEGKIGLMRAENMGRETYRFVMRAMADPESRRKIKELARQLELEKGSEQ